jgi:hypothetical protein
MGEIRAFGKLVSLSTALFVIVFFTFNIISSIKLDEFASFEIKLCHIYDFPFQIEGFYTFFPKTFLFLILYFILSYCIFNLYLILGIFIHKLRLSKMYYLIWLISFLLIIAISFFKDFSERLFF